MWGVLRINHENTRLVHDLTSNGIKAIFSDVLPWQSIPEMFSTSLAFKVLDPELDGLNLPEIVEKWSTEDSDVLRSHLLSAGECLDLRSVDAQGIVERFVEERSQKLKEFFRMQALLLAGVNPDGNAWENVADLVIESI